MILHFLLLHIVTLSSITYRYTSFHHISLHFLPLHIITLPSITYRYTFSYYLPLHHAYMVHICCIER